MSMYKTETRTVINLLRERPASKMTAKRAIVLLMRLDSQIDRLYKELGQVQVEQYTNGRNDGIREFAARLKDMRKIVFEHLDDMDVVFVNEIDSLVKVMTEVHNAKENSV